MRSVWQWLKSLVQRYGHDVERPDEHLKLAEAIRDCPGQWVAIDRRTGHVVAAGPTPYELSAYIKEHNIHGVEMLRAPAVGEPEVVGIG